MGMMGLRTMIMGVMTVNSSIVKAMAITVIAALMVTMCIDNGGSREEYWDGKDLTIGEGGNTTSNGGGNGHNPEGGDGNGGGSGGGGSGKVKIVFWHTFQYAKEVELINDAVKRFEEENPNIEIDVQQQTYEDAVEKYITASLGGEAPDVMRVPNDRLGDLAKLDLIMPLDQYISVTSIEDYVPMAINAMRYDGKIYALPASYDSVALIYNKDMLAEKGYDEAPKTLNELVSMAKALTYGDRYGFVTPITDPYWWFPFQYGFGGEIFDENNRPMIYSQASINATNFLFDLEKTHGVMPKGGVDKNLMLSLFTEQKAAMIVTGPWNIGDIESADINYGIAPLPGLSATGRACAPLVGVKGYVISKTSAHKEEAYEFIKFLTSAEVTKDFALISHTLPSVKSVYQDKDIANDPVIQGFLAQAEQGQPAPSIPEMSKVWGPLTDALQLAYSGDKTVEDALRDAQQEIEASIEES